VAKDHSRWVETTYRIVEHKIYLYTEWGLKERKLSKTLQWANILKPFGIFDFDSSNSKFETIFVE